MLLLPTWLALQRGPAPIGLLCRRLSCLLVCLGVMDVRCSSKRPEGIGAAQAGRKECTVTADHSADGTVNSSPEFY